MGSGIINMNRKERLRAAGEHSGRGERGLSHGRNLEDGGFDRKLTLRHFLDAHCSSQE